MLSTDVNPKHIQIRAIKFKDDNRMSVEYFLWMTKHDIRASDPFLCKNFELILFILRSEIFVDLPEKREYDEKIVNLLSRHDFIWIIICVKFRTQYSL